MSHLARTNTVPIPRASTSAFTPPNIESVISLPRPLGAAPTTPQRPINRTAARSFEPRVIRPDCSQSPNRARKPSLKTSSSARQAVPITQSPANDTFAPPAYLNHSALRHLLHTEPPPSAKKADNPPREVVSYPKRGPTPTSDSDDDSSISLPPFREATSGNASVLAKERILRLPTRWSEKWRHPSLSVSVNGRDVTFEGISCSGDRDAAAARTNFCIPPACGVYYYEVQIISKGQKGHISIGFAGPEVRPSRLPGWEPNSWGYHGDDGCSFAAEKNGTPYGPMFGTGDTIGCGVDFTTNRAFFTRNGVFLGMVFENVGKGVDIYPAIGLRHNGEKIRANFGHEPFSYDINFFVRQQRVTTWNRVMETPIQTHLLATPELEEDSKSQVVDLSNPSSPVPQDQVKEKINDLVLAYLAHHGYSRTIRAMRQQCSPSEEPSSVPPIPEDGDVDMDADTKLSSSVKQEENIELRTKVVQSVIAGDVDTAMRETEAHYPSVLAANEGIMLFKMRCRKFIELVLETAEIKKRMQEKSPSLPPVSRPAEHDGIISGHMDGVDTDGMDIDDGHGSSSSSSLAWTKSRSSVRGTTSGRSDVAQYEAALNDALAYGKTIHTEHFKDSRPEVQAISKQTFGLLAYEDPLEPGSPAAEIAGQQARVNLANELNQAILRSQGLPTDPALETIYRHTGACLSQLGMIGVGSAAFVDMKSGLGDK